jgi:hypothetical protein
MRAPNVDGALYFGHDARALYALSIALGHRTPKSCARSVWTPTVWRAPSRAAWQWPRRERALATCGRRCKRAKPPAWISTNARAPS